MFMHEEYSSYARQHSKSVGLFERSRSASDCCALFHRLLPSQGKNVWKIWRGWGRTSSWDSRLLQDIDTKKKKKKKKKKRRRKRKRKKEEIVQCLHEAQVLLQLNKLAKFQWFRKPNHIPWDGLKKSEIKISGVIGTKERIYVSHYVKDVEHSSNRKCLRLFQIIEVNFLTPESM